MRECAIEEQEIDKEIGVTSLESIFFTDEGEVHPKFNDEVLDVGDNLLPEIILLV